MWNTLRWAAFAILTAIPALPISTTHAQTSGDRSNASSPSNPYIDRGTCPFECCTYRDWIANEGMVLVDRPDGKKIVARIEKGEKVQAMTGEIHSIARRVIASQDSKRPNADFPNHRRGPRLYSASARDTAISGHLARI